MNRYKKILNELGTPLAPGARILDFGCGAGRTVYCLIDQGYDASGYDMKDYLELRAPSDRARFFISENGCLGRLPFDDNSFDLVISEQVLEHVMDPVAVLRELHRVLRFGGCAIHVFPARYCLIEPHIYVPFGGFIAHRWWYWIFAVLGIRNEHQKGLSAIETADRNASYYVESLNYIPNSCYQSVWNKLGYEYKWIDQENFDSSERVLVRLLGRVNRFFPILGWINRTFYMRRVWLKKIC